MALSSEGGRKAWERRFEVWVEACTEVHRGAYDYSRALERVQDKGVWKVRVLCPEHGEFLQSPAKHKSGQGCPVCAGTRIVNPLETLRRIYPDFGFSDDLVVSGSKDKLTLTCHEHGEFVATFNQLTQVRARNKHVKSPCPTCNSATSGMWRALGNGEILRRLQVKFPDYVFIPHASMRVMDKVRYVCPRHGESSSVINDLLDGHGCSACGAEARKRRIMEVVGVTPLQNVLDVFTSHGGTLIPHLSTINRTHGKVRVSCVRHGGFEIDLYTLKAGHGCLRCKGRVSKGESELTEWLKTLGVKVVTQERRLLERGEVDIYLPDHGLAIEYCGLYWHGDTEWGRKDRWYHLNKMKDAGKAGVRLITLFEDEWLDRPQAVKETLRSALGLTDRVLARKLHLERVEWAKVAPFYDALHLQGAGSPCGENYALMSDGTVLAAASFKNDRFGTCDYELVRYASSRQVVGGFARLLAAFSKGKAGSTLVSYCDMRWFSGGAYARNGFVLAGLSEPGYWWCKANKRYSRFRYQKHKLEGLLPVFDAALSESENMCNNKFWKIWDCGMSKWVRTL